MSSKPSQSNHRRPYILFVSANKGGGGSEELWLQTALLLSQGGQQVSALTAWTQDASRRVKQLETAGISHQSLAGGSNLLNRVLARIWPSRFSAKGRVSQHLSALAPDLVLFSSGTSLDGLELLESIAASKVPYAVVTHLVSTDHWPDDLTAERMVRLFSGAKRFWAVSRHNLELLETQLAHRIPHACIARNPFLVKGFPTPMPGEAGSSLVRFAIPARLHPRTKGHDILLRVLSQRKWKDRHWEASIFGSGAHGERLKALASMLGIEDKVRFCGQTSDIQFLWESHHALLLPSRHEGLPLTLVEAMWAGRVVIAQPAGGIAELLNDGQTGFLAEGIGEKFFDEVMERAWSQRSRWQEIASAAAGHIRTVIPEHPEKIFARELLELAQDSMPKA